MWGLAEQCRKGWGGLGGLPVTFLVHCLTVLISSEITMSTHLRHGSRIFFTCFFTMVSKAMSGVNSPVLNARSRRRAQCHWLALVRSARPGSLSSPCTWGGRVLPLPFLSLSDPILSVGWEVLLRGFPSVILGPDNSA